MADYFEIDFLSVETKKSGDAITLRYEIDGKTFIHVVDGGFQSTGDSIVEHINKYYGNPSFIDHVVVTHHDRDHTGGLAKVLESFEVGTLWMHRPWLYAEDLIKRFARFTDIENLRARLRDIYPNVVELEDVALKRKIIINEAFQATKIGAFTVMAPTKSRYLDLVVESDKTPEAAKEVAAKSLGDILLEKATAFVALVKSAWGIEVFPPADTSPENEMSVVQFAILCDKKILLTGDTGRTGLTETADYAPTVGLVLPGIDTFQVPHHGSRRNVSTETLNRLLGEPLPNKPEGDGTKFSAIISSAKEDENHPRKAVVRAMHHRGASVVSTEGQTITTRKNAPNREGWSAVTPLEYPEDQEE